MLGPRPGPLAVAIAAATGIAAAAMLDPLGVPPWSHGALAAAAIAACGAALRSRGRPATAAADRSRWLWLVAALALGFARGGRAAIVAPPGVIVDDRGVDRVIGTVRGPITHGAHGDGALLDTGDAAIWLWAETRLVPGARVAVTGAVHTPRGLLDPAVADRGDAARARGAELEVTARAVERLGDAGGLVDRAWRWAGDAQAAWARAIDDAGGDPVGRAALRGIAVGDRGEVPPALDQRWRAVGIYHVLSVSGLHLAVVAGLAFSLLRRLVAASPWGGRTRPARWAAPPALVLAIAYTMITGAQLATLRSLIAIALVLIAQLLDRPLRLIDAIGVAAIAILLWRPADLFDPSFQLSFVAALTLALGAASGAHRRGVRGWLVRGLRSSAWVAITTAPLTAWHFHQVCAGGVIGNLVLTPIVELVALPLGLAGAVLGVAPAITAASWLVGLADRGAAVLAGVAPVGHVAVAGAGMMAVLVALSLGLAARAGTRDRITAALWLALCLAWSLGRSPPPIGALRATFLDVGQGDAALIELPDGAVWLIDAGGNPGARDLVAASAPGRVVDRVLAAYGHARIALAIVSHPHPDHYLGLAAIEAPIDELWSAADGGPSRAPARSPRSAMPGFDAIAAALAARGTRLVHPALGVARTEAGVELEVWAPSYQPEASAAPRCASDPVRTVNDNSLVVALHYRGRTIVFAGDIEAEGEDGLVAAGIGAADVVKVAHHGSPTSSTAGFVAATHPRLAVISCGAANAFGFPALEVVERWSAAGAELARTDRDGAITVTIGAEGALEIDRFARDFAR
jgi:competence protein ComEC